MVHGADSGALGYEEIAAISASGAQATLLFDLGSETIFCSCDDLKIVLIHLLRLRQQVL
jgi:hypothetical protein